jgi:hypothetical protein
MAKNFLRERNMQFLKICEQIRNKHNGYISLANIATKANKATVESFYLSQKRIAIILYNFINEKNYKSTAQNREIVRQYQHVKKQHPNYCINQIAKILANNTLSVPSFFLSDFRAVNLYYDLLKHLNGRNLI